MVNLQMFKDLFDDRQILKDWRPHIRRHPSDATAFIAEAVHVDCCFMSQGRTPKEAWENVMELTYGRGWRQVAFMVKKAA